MKRPATRIADKRKHLMRSLGRALVAGERLTTTLARAKALRPFVEGWVTLAKKVATSDGAAQLAAERRLRAEVQLGDVLTKLTDDLAKRTANRQGGYTRILKLGYRVGDAAPKALIEFVDKPTPAPVTKTKTTATTKAAKQPAVTKAK